MSARLNNNRRKASSRTMPFAFFLLALSVTISVHAEIQKLGPMGGDFRAIGILDDLVLAGTDDGRIYRSLDRAFHWKPLTIRDFPVSTVIEEISVSHADQTVYIAVR
ncbi:hypothetical protein JXA80_13245, partial [bacterium]|nr:hypothetical protein [candidate division CSSED10-310 bacterium]